ncbi:hypothetical protein B0H19DRAFT_1076498 [Mycena capillaripes]|nr:hypothetical protein B0H19DRAFT_1076498 [Mycena capillaripes]
MFGSLTVPSIKWIHGTPADLSRATTCATCSPKGEEEKAIGNGASRGWLESWIYGPISLASAVTCATPWIAAFCHDPGHREVPGRTSITVDIASKAGSSDQPLRFVNLQNSTLFGFWPPRLLQEVAQYYRQHLKRIHNMGSVSESSTLDLSMVVSVAPVTYNNLSPTWFITLQWIQQFSNSRRK